MVRHRRLTLTLTLTPTLTLTLTPTLTRSAVIDAEQYAALLDALALAVDWRLMSEEEGVFGRNAPFTALEADTKFRIRYCRDG